MEQAEDINQEAVQQFIEDLSIALATDGMSRMGARVLAAIICFHDPEGPTQADLANDLSASPAAISTATRELIATNHIKKVSLPRERADRYQLNDIAEATIDTIVTKNREIASVYKHGLELFPEGSAPYDIIKRNHDFHTKFATMAAAIPPMLASQRKQASRQN